MKGFKMQNQVDYQSSIISIQNKIMEIGLELTKPLNSNQKFELAEQLSFNVSLLTKIAENKPK